MKPQILKKKGSIFILVAVLMAAFGTQNISYAQEGNPTITASVQAPLTEAALNGSVVTLTLSGVIFERSTFRVRDGVTVSGIDGVTVGTFDIDRISDTKVTVELTFSGNIDADTPLIFTVGAGGIADYDGDALTAQLPVTAVAETLVATTETLLLEESIREGDIILTELPLTEANLYGSAIRLTLTGRQFAEGWRIEDALTLSSPDGRIVEPDDITPAGDTAVEINGEVVDIDDVEHLNDIGFIGIDDIDRVSDSEVLIALAFSGDLSADATLTLAVGEDAILGYNKGFTFEFPVTAVEESLTASTEFPLTEKNLDGSIVRLSLSGRQLWVNADLDEIVEEGAMTISGIEGVTIEDISFTLSTWLYGYGDVIIRLGFDGNFDTDATLTITVAAPMIVGYNKNFTVKLPVTARKQSDATISVSPSRIALPGIGEKLTLNLNIADSVNVAGYQATLSYNPNALKYVEGGNGDFLPADAFFIDSDDGYDWDYSYNVVKEYLLIAGNTLAEVSNGDGTLATLTFEVVDYIPFPITLSDVYLVDADGKRWEVTTENGEVIEPPGLAKRIFGDLNLDGIVNIQDLIIVSEAFGSRGIDGIRDVNGDGLVDIVDLVLVANALGADAAAPSLNPQGLELLTAADVKEWLTQAQKITLTDPDYRRGISVLEQLHKALTPKETLLLPNFPNPFNPETWIPYHLAKDADVTLHIYAMNGTLVRTLAIGHQAAGVYQSRSRAAYWDGKNEFGESVASGVYFYTLKAGDFSATRKMLIWK